IRLMRIRRTTTITIARVGSATTSPSGPSRLPTTSTAMIVSTGGNSTCLDITRGETRLPSIRCTITPTPSTSNARVPPLGPVSTNAAGNVVLSSEPKNGTIATMPVNTPNVSQYGTFSTQRKNAVRIASTVMV